MIIYFEWPIEMKNGQTVKYHGYIIDNFQLFSLKLDVEDRYIDTSEISIVIEIPDLVLGKMENHVLETWQAGESDKLHRTVEIRNMEHGTIEGIRCECTPIII